MSHDSVRRPSRREMFRDVARSAALGGLAVVSGLLLFRGGGASAPGRCQPASACSGCPSRFRCTDPKALEARRVRKG
ncbi:MAG: hypothetical protein ACYTG0_45895 [Planctomycetota bacterium]|jgi:hypothetical protein